MVAAAHGVRERLPDAGRKPTVVVTTQDQRREARPPAGSAAIVLDWTPVGVRHAVALSQPDRSPSAHALCGVNIRQWAIFPAIPYLGSTGADCMRCTQMVRQATAPR